MKRPEGSVIALLLPVGLLFALAARGGTGEVPPRAARFTWGALGPRRGLAVGKKYLYFVDAGNRLRIRAKEDLLPASARPREGGPALAPGTLPLPGIAEDIAVVSTHRLVCATGLHVVLIDLTDPAAPREIASTPVSDREEEGAGRLLVRGDTLYLAARLAGLARARILADRIEILERLPLPGLATDLCAIDGDTLAVALDAGVALVETGGRPRMAAYFDVPHTAWCVAAAGDRLYVGGKEEVGAYAISDPHHPVRVGRGVGRDPFFFSWHDQLAVGDGRLYAARTEGGLYVYGTPAREGRLPVLWQSSQWQTSKVPTREDKLAYLADLGLPPTSPGAKAFLAWPGYRYLIALSLRIEGDRIYVNTKAGRVAVFGKGGGKRGLRLLGFYD